MTKKKLATVWLGGCSGCHMSLLDIDERILEVISLADLVKCPIVDAKEFPQVDVALVEGAVSGDEHLRELLHIRKQSRVLVSLGDCAVTANVTGMRNYFSKEDVLKRSYVDAVSNDKQGQMPDHPTLLKLRDKAVPLHEIVHVDYMIPGCPPSADTIFYVIKELLNDRVPHLEREGKLKYG